MRFPFPSLPFFNFIRYQIFRPGPSGSKVGFGSPPGGIVLRVVYSERWCWRVFIAFVAGMYVLALILLLLKNAFAIAYNAQRLKCRLGEGRLASAILSLTNPILFLCWT